MEFLLSCISTKHSMLKQHWVQSREQTQCPLTVLGSRQKPKEDQGGLLCVFDHNDGVQRNIRMTMPAGMVPSRDGVLVASVDAIYELSTNLDHMIGDEISLPSFNLLHSLSRTQHGYLVASTGLDAILEFTRQGELIWSWWATDHGFEFTPTGERRILDKSADHRGVKYGTLAQTTHVNSAAELPDGTILASLFHQGMIVAIDRATGDWRPVLEGLDHPHSIRILDEHHITLADTGRGRALRVEIKDRRGSVETEIDAHTTWLQDCLYDYRTDAWVLVDGKNTQITLRQGSKGEKLLNQLNLDPEWRLYEVLPL